MLKFLLTALPLLAACNSGITTASDQDQDACRASEYESLIGSNIAAFSHEAGANIRIIGPNTMVTRDYRPERLNVSHAADGTITGVSCG